MENRLHFIKRQHDVNFIPPLQGYFKRKNKIKLVVHGVRGKINHHIMRVRGTSNPKNIFEGSKASKDNQWSNVVGKGCEEEEEVEEYEECEGKMTL